MESPLLQISANLRNSTSVDPSPQNIDNAGYIDVASVNQQLFNSTPASPLTPQNINSVVDSSMTIGPFSGVFSHNISSSGASMAALSGIFKLTMFYGDTVHGRSESHTWNGGADTTFAQASLASIALMQQRAILFGNQDNAVGTSAIRLGNCGINFYRLADAVNPRNSQLFQTSGITGPNTTVNKGCDVLSTAIAARLKGTSAANNTQTTNLLITGQSDTLVANEQIDFVNFGPIAGRLWVTLFRDYMNYLITPANKWGFMGQAAGETKFALNTFTYANGLLSFTATGNNWAAGDKIRLTRVNAPGFSGPYVIAAIGANGLVSIPISLAANPPLPTAGTGQRYQLQDGTRKQDFYAYTSHNYPQLKVSKKNPGRYFSGVSFPKRKKRPAR